MCRGWLWLNLMKEMMRMLRCSFNGFIDAYISLVDVITEGIVVLI